MKIASLVFLALFSGIRASAQWVVIDAANLQQNIAQYAALVQQISNQASQITNQVQQIQQFDTELNRLGDMASIRNLIGFPELELDLSLPTKTMTWSASLSAVDGAGLFGDTRGGIFVGISRDYVDFDGATVERDPAVYKPSHEVTNKVDNFKDVQSDVYARREELRKAIADTSDAVSLATSDAEEKKQRAVLDTQYHQLATLDADVSLSAAEIQVKAAESTAMADAKSKADAEARKHLASQETTKLTTAFKPYYGCMLQYVTEKKFTP